jgi:hypothetical protein
MEDRSAGLPSMNAVIRSAARMQVSMEGRSTDLPRGVAVIRSTMSMGAGEFHTSSGRMVTIAHVDGGSGACHAGAQQPDDIGTRECQICGPDLQTKRIAPYIYEPNGDNAHGATDTAVIRENAENLPY